MTTTTTVTAALSTELIRLLGPDRVLTDPVDLDLYRYDASMETGRPDLVAIPATTAELAAIVNAVLRHGVPYVVRGAGTGYSGGALAVRGGVTILTRDLNAILELNVAERWVRCQPGVVLADLQRHVAAAGLRYLPDPSSYRVCTIGGNIAENAGGPHALGFGPTSNFVISVDVLLPDGSTATFSESDPYDGGLDLRALLVGGEGTIGVITAAILRLVPEPESQRVVMATFADQDDAVRMVERVVGDGLTPTALDMLTGAYLPGAAAGDDPSVLFIDVEGRDEEVAAQTSAMVAMAASLGGTAKSLRVDTFLEERATLVRDKVRRMISASGLPRYYLFDCVAPRGRLRDLMTVLREAADRYRLPLLNTFHAGDGNVHPAPFYDPADPGHQDRLRGFLAHVLARCAELGGAVSGEHGVGLEKRDLMELFHDPGELAAMGAVKRLFDPEGLCNPGKILPSVLPSPRPATHSASRALDVDLANGVVTVSTGVTFDEVTAALDGSAFELAYEPWGGPADEEVLAAVDAGRPGRREPYRIRARDLIVSATLAGAGGAVRTFGGICAKDVSGYELRKLVFGGRGRLGRLVSARLRLSARPVARHAVVVDCDSVDEALALAGRLHRTTLPFAYLMVTGSTGRLAVEVGLEAFGGRLDRAATELAAIARGGAPPVEAGTFDRMLPGGPWAHRDDLVARHAGGQSFRSIPALGATWVNARGPVPPGTTASWSGRLAEAVSAAW
ncbi:FAD-linked oxidase C-terminal domain-containing protein [Micromonospora lupini]|uniref:FAD-binding oxidoreductase n=1 Tax=Micromonospora lupini TaxID=285679 RepID=UPI0033E0F549